MYVQLQYEMVICYMRIHFVDDLGYKIFNYLYSELKKIQTLIIEMGQYAYSLCLYEFCIFLYII